MDPPGLTLHERRSPYSQPESDGHPGRCRATFEGATLSLRATGTEDPGGTRPRIDLELHAETSDLTFGRGLARVSADGPLFGRIGYGVALSAGTSLGNVPVQRAWQIGGASTVRGHDAASLRGPSVWFARAELTRGAPAFQLSLFGDAGWAGDRADFWRATPLRALGVGVSLLDGLLRVDVARGIGGGGTRGYLRLGAGL